MSAASGRGHPSASGSMTGVVSESRRRGSAAAQVLQVLQRSGASSGVGLWPAESHHLTPFRSTPRRNPPPPRRSPPAVPDPAAPPLRRNSTSLLGANVRRLDALLPLARFAGDECGEIRCRASA